MTYRRRWADPESAARYPFQSVEPIRFEREGRRYVWRWALGALPAGQIVVPSFGTADGMHQWTLSAGGTDWPLLPVPSTQGERPDRGQPDTPVSAHIDCWHTHERLADASLTLRTSLKPERYLVAVTTRALQLEQPVPSGVRAHAEVPATLSQMDGPERIRHHICSPTSVAMLLGRNDLSASASACHDAATGLYGSWAMAIRTAWQGGAVAAVECFDSWEAPAELLSRGLPFAASIRFAQDTLAGAPMASSGGHLVVVSGIEPDGVTVYDPAAPSVSAVPRRYDLTEFTHAWLAHRGAAYIIAP